jgi:predicted metalloprotease
LAQVVAVVVAYQEQPLAAQARQVDAVLVEEEEAAHRQAHAVLVVLAATDSSWSTKYSRYEQSLRDTRWHRPQHHRP